MQKNFYLHAVFFNFLFNNYKTPSFKAIKRRKKNLTTPNRLKIEKN